MTQWPDVEAGGRPRALGAWVLGWEAWGWRGGQDSPPPAVSPQGQRPLRAGQWHVVGQGPRGAGPCAG